jgi:hypothetical protein
MPRHIDVASAVRSLSHVILLWIGVGSVPQRLKAYSRGPSSPD